MNISCLPKLPNITWATVAELIIIIQKRNKWFLPRRFFHFLAQKLLSLGTGWNWTEEEEEHTKKRHVKREHFPGLLLTACIWKYTWIALKLILWQKIQSFVFVVAVVVFFCLFRISKKKREYYWNRAQKKNSWVIVIIVIIILIVVVVVVVVVGVVVY